MDQQRSCLAYVLVTPARNEEAFIEKTIESVIHQTLLPLKWVIVDDGSTDRTAGITEIYANKYRWIELVRRPPRQDRSFAGKVLAFQAGFETLQNVPYDLIGNLDADITFGADHFEFLVSKFLEDSTLGVAGTAYHEEGWDSTQDSFEGASSVSGACQIFRYQCFCEIGGYRPNQAGGIDWIAVTTARMKGWKTRNFPERRFQHPRAMGTAERSLLGKMFDYGKKDYFLGGSPVWEIFRVGYRVMKRPFLVGGLALLLGYCWAALTRVKRPISADLMQFHRREQMTKLKAILGSVVRLRKPEKFSLES